MARRRRSRFWMRAASAFLLVFGLAGGVQVAQLRAHQQREAAEDRATQELAAGLRQARMQQNAAWLADAPLRQAAADAQSKANALASAGASQAAVVAAAALAAGAVGLPGSAGPTPTSCQDYTGNQALGCTLLLQWGFGLDQMPCLVTMWNHESNWRTNAENSIGAYGIPQALPGTKLAAYGADWRTNPATQIKWGLDYIKNRYGTPCKAWTYWQAHSWY